MSFQLELSRRAFLILLVVIGLLLIGIVLVVFLPSAKVTLIPAQETRSVTQEITLAKDAEGPDFVRFVLPAHIVETELEETKTITREAKDAKEDFARGKVTLINDQDEDQPLLPKTHLRHEASGKQFLTDAAVRIPPKGRVDVTVTAEEIGSGSNVAAGTFIVDRLPLPMQSVVHGESTQTFSGGLVTDAVVSEQEVTKAKEEISQALRERAVSELTLKAGGASVNPDLVHFETILDESSAEPGSKAVSFEVKQKVRVRAFVADQNDLLSLTLLALRSNSTQEEEFVAYDPASFTATIGRADFERGQARITGTLTGTFARKIEPSVLSGESIIGLGTQETIEHFEKFPSVGKAEVQFSPFWVQSVPSRRAATEISVRQPQQ
ncbi:MAG: baseplate J/gp47 family protein [Candidatus Andersenbacteria bacterium]|nr:baseplate J/gp47 family protein [Candidatus Andersenbacteria bacterium]MBI3250514.1 baseplate J/gp47 family protein [Candidatus Andersenbacteria bacterium]